jgi:hypothetical protein
VLGDGVRDREGVDARDERGGVNDVIPRKLRGIVNKVRFQGIVHGFIATYTKSPVQLNIVFQSVAMCDGEKLEYFPQRVRHRRIFT